MRHQSGKLLVVDDNPVVLLGMTELLRSAGFDVVEARSGAEAVEHARQHRPDLVLLDVRLPDVDGIELCRRLKADPTLNRLFVVLLSSIETSSGSQASGLDAGADGYIARPIENRELLARVQSLLRIQHAESALRAAQDELERRVEERTVELARANAGLRAMSLRLVELQESERRILARELHDEVGQWLTGLKLTVDRLLPLASGTLRDQLNTAVDTINTLIERMRYLSRQLRPQILDDLGLVVALDWHLNQYTEQTGVAVDFRHTPVPHRLPAVIETAIFRIVQEALTNVARHARIKQASVRLWVNDQQAGVLIEDKGAGFDADATLARRESTGLAGMRERAELLEGEFTLESTPGQGTRVTVELPLDNGTQPSDRAGGTR